MIIILFNKPTSIEVKFMDFTSKFFTSFIIYAICKNIIKLKHSYSKPNIDY